MNITPKTQYPNETGTSPERWESHNNYGAENINNSYPLEVRAPFRGDMIQIAAVYHHNAEANARLIAAAPETAAERDKLKEINADLQAALKLAYYTLEEVSYKHGSEFIGKHGMDELRAAIAKAKGK